ncbi:hypothetical protein [Roseovarius sp. MMSF_3305]|uniref:hypothetical protein n=1 Tax=Roseovarius sp. MMSF_3305 TaxID=3046697 RepID=UPI00273D81A9|nr:hypothetical protein [Roseovarius sp. MMSF_3305]
MAINRRQTRFIFAKSEEPQFVAQPLQIASPCGRSGDRAAAFGLDSAPGRKPNGSLVRNAAIPLLIQTFASRVTRQRT